MASRTDTGQEAAGAAPDAARPVPAGRAEAREQAILDAALALVVEVGYDGLSMDSLAERARASKATIYRHWSGKAEVVAAAVRCRTAQAPREEPDTGSLRGDLLALMERATDSLDAEDGALIAAVVWAMRSDPVLAGLMRKQMVEGKRAAVQDVIRRAEARGECPAGIRADTVAEVMPAMMLSRLLVSGEPLDAAFATHLVDDVLLPLLR